MKFDKAVIETWRLESASFSLISMSSRLAGNFDLLSVVSWSLRLTRLGIGDVEAVHSDISISNATLRGGGLRILPPLRLPKLIVTEAAMPHSLRQNRPAG